MSFLNAAQIFGANTSIEMVNGRRSLVISLDAQKSTADGGSISDPAQALSAATLDGLTTATLDQHADALFATFVNRIQQNTATAGVQQSGTTTPNNLNLWIQETGQLRNPDGSFVPLQIQRGNNVALRRQFTLYTYAASAPLGFTLEEIG